MISAADRAYYADEIRLAIMRLNQQYGSECPTPVIRWDLKGTSRLGTARGSIEINLSAQHAQHMGRDLFRQTALHEACHIVTTWRRNRLGLGHQSSGRWSAHGAEWRGAMRRLGLNPDRTCSVPLDVQAKLKPARTVRKVSVVCNCQVHHVTLAVYEKIKLGAKYRCKGCRTPVLPFTTDANGVITRRAS